MKASDFKDFLKKAKKVVPTKSTIDVFTTVLMQGNELIVRSEVGQYRCKIAGMGADLDVCVYFADFEKLMAKLKDLEVVFGSGRDGSAFEVITSKGTFKLSTYDRNAKNARPFEVINGDFISTCTLSVSDTVDILKAVNYTVSGQMREYMEVVRVEPLKIVATDGHALKYGDRQEEGQHETFSIPKAMTALMDKKEYRVSLCNEVFYGGVETTNTAIKLEGENGEEIIWIQPSGRFPDWRSVIPREGTTETTLILDTAMLLETIDFAKSVEVETKLLIFDLKPEIDGCVVISRQDVEAGKSYSRTIETDITGKDQRVGLNLELLEKAIKTEGLKEFSFEFSDPTRAVVVNKNLLIMSMMIVD